MVTNEIRPLTGIRGLAAMWVVCLHFEHNLTQLMPGLSVFHPLFIQGGYGVDMFFVLSGFVIATVYKIEKFNLTPLNYRNFLVNRIARILPDYQFCLLVLAAIVIADQWLAKQTVMLGKHMTDAAFYPVGDVVWHILMMQAWPFIPTDWRFWNTPAWSVSAEWFAYLFLFPISIGLASLSFVKRHPLKLAFGLLVLFVFFARLKKVDLHGGYFICQITAEFLGGCLMYLFCLSNQKSARSVSVWLDWVILAFVAVIWFSEVSILSDFLIILALPLIIVGLTNEVSLFAKLLSSSVFCYLGRVSYALYLVHGIAQRMLHVLLPVDHYVAGPFFMSATILMAYLIFPLLVAMGIYHVIEEPSRLAIRRWGSSRSP